MSNTRIRSSNWVRWYCFGLESHKKLLLSCYCGENLAAYGIFRNTVKRDNQEGARPAKFLECLDVWHDPSLPEGVNLIMEKALKIAQEAGMLGLLTFEYPPIASWLRKQRHTIISKGDPNGLYLLPPSLEITLDKGCSYFLLAEGDVGL
jgi:hypothetical protein